MALHGSECKRTNPLAGDPALQGAEPRMALRRHRRSRPPGPGRTVPAQVEENESGTLSTEMETATLRNFARPVAGKAVF